MPSKSQEELAECIQPDKIAEKGFLKPLRIEMFPDEINGDPIYQIFLHFPDSTPDSDFEYDNLKEMLRWIRREIWEGSGYESWPVVRLGRESELLADPA